ncbi:hypothetical protein INT47_013094 [Mucor saturninus]|uniref:Uncharacterized protein n=1 Tax=Mucor saturninus TaxID=64648 RepID=A0A8H7V3Y0_9FUNG|nr:hypothetical protein INT47_013094 [Mucor saturninus]
MVSFRNGYYPYVRTSVGLMYTSHTTYKCAEKVVMYFIQLKRSIYLSLPDDDMDIDEEFTVVEKNDLLPNVVYNMVLYTQRWLYYLTMQILW